jgi:protease II
MKYLKSFKILENKNKAEFNFKIRELKQKWKETDIKMDEIKSKIRSEKDGNKQELLVLTLQKLAAKQEMLEIDMQINKLKRTML